MIELQRRPTPDRIVDGERVHVGRFERPFRTVNLDEAPAQHLFARLRGRGLGLGEVERVWRRMRLKQWHYASIATPWLFVGAVVFDAGYVGVGFAYVVDRKTGHAREWSKTVPLARGVELAANSTDGRTRFAQKGFGEIRFENDGATGVRRLQIDLEARPDTPGFVVDYEMREQEVEPVIAVGEPGPGRWLYTHKAYGLPAGGRIVSGAWNETTKMGQALAGFDWNRGYRLTETYWNWAAAAGRDTRGRTVGFTFTSHARQGDAERGTNRANDSAMWLGGKIVDLGEVRFSYDPEDILLPWRIRDAEGLVDLEFQPLGERVEDLDLKVIVSRFHQPYGTFRGSFRNRNGETFAVVDLFGVTEQHFARW